MKKNFFFRNGKSLNFQDGIQEQDGQEDEEQDGQEHEEQESPKKQEQDEQESLKEQEQESLEEQIILQELQEEKIFKDLINQTSVEV